MHLSALALLVSLLGWLVPSALAEDPTGILKVRSSVAGAEVWVDGALLGKAPVTKYLEPGAHTLRVVADYHDPFVRKIDLVADRTLDVNATLSPGAGTIEFSGPPGARVSIDGVDRGPLPIRLPAPSPGARRWRVEAPKMEPVEGVLELVAGRNYLVEARLQSSAGVFVVESTPAGARVELDGEDVGVTPLRLEGVPLGKHGVLVALDGRAMVARSVDTTDGSRGEVQVSMPEEGATLTLSTGRDDAAVYLNEVLVGEGATVKIGPMEKGRAKLRVTAAGEEIAEDTVAVPPRGSVALRVSGDDVVERKPLVQRWGFWAVVGGGVAAGGVAAGVAAAMNEPPPLPEGDVVVALP